MRSLIRTGNLDLNTTLLKKNTRSRKKDPRRPIFQSFSGFFVSCSGSILDVGQALKKYWGTRGLLVSKRHSQITLGTRHGMRHTSSDIPFVLCYVTRNSNSWPVYKRVRSSVLNGTLLPPLSHASLASGSKACENPDYISYVRSPVR